MANKIFYQEDCNLGLLDGKTIAIIGYGSQGHAHALNLKESGCNVIIGLYKGSKSWAKAEAEVKKGDILFVPPLLLHSVSLAQPQNEEMISETYVFHHGTGFYYL